MTRVLLLALGNELMGDDGVGPAVGRALQQEPGDRPGLDVVVSSQAGLALLEHMEGYERALIVDAISTGRCPAGTLLEYGPEELRTNGTLAIGVAPSPHFSGLPEVLAMADRLGIPFPNEIKVLAMEIAPPDSFGEGLSPEVRRAIPAMLQRTRQLIDGDGRPTTDDRRPTTDN